jgi:hypothetical protein
MVGDSLSSALVVRTTEEIKTMVINKAKETKKERELFLNMLVFLGYRYLIYH